MTVLITTYNRPELLDRLLEQIPSWCNVSVYDDGSTRPYTLPDNIYTKCAHHGKTNYWKLVNRIFSEIPEDDHYIMLPDDVTLEDNFFEKAVKLWENLEDKHKICLSLLLDKSWIGKPNWTNYPHRTIIYKNISYYRTQWVDMCFIAGPEFFRVLGGIHPIPKKRWDDNKYLGSGVGQQISMRLYKRHNLYQVTESLVHHGDHVSMMNRMARRKTPIIS